MLDGWKGVVVVLASFALLGALVFLKVPEAAVAAVAVVQIVIAWVAKPPTKGPGANAVPWLAVASVLGFLSACFPADQKIEAAAGYEAQQMACVDRNPDRASIDACRKRVKDAWASTPDAGADAGKDGSK